MGGKAPCAMGAVKVDRGYLKALNVARHEIRELLAREKCTPLLIRLAFNDALTFDKATNTAGVNASIRCGPFPSTSGLLLRASARVEAVVERMPARPGPRRSSSIQATSTLT